MAAANYNLPNEPTDTNAAPVAYMGTTGTSDGTCPRVGNAAMKQGGKYCNLQHAQDNGCTIPGCVRAVERTSFDRIARLAALEIEAEVFLAANRRRLNSDARLDSKSPAADGPLDDDHPARIGSSYPSEENGDPIYQTWMDPGQARERFQSSMFVRNVWPDGLRKRTTPYFALEDVLDDLSVWGRLHPVGTLQGILTRSTQHTLPLLFMGTEPNIQRIALRL